MEKPQWVSKSTFISRQANCFVEEKQLMGIANLFPQFEADNIRFFERNCVFQELLL